MSAALHAVTVDGPTDAEDVDLYPGRSEYEAGLIGSLCWSTLDAVRAVLAVLADEDLDNGPARYALTLTRSLVAEGSTPDAQLLWDAADRGGIRKHERTASRFADFLALAVVPAPPRSTPAGYARAVLRDAERRALAALADTLADIDPDVCPLADGRAAVDRYRSTLADLDRRLSLLADPVDTRPAEAGERTP